MLKYMIAVTLLAGATKVLASEYRVGTPNGNEISKGQAVVMLAKDDKAVIYKVDRVELNIKKGTIVVVKKD